MRNRRLRLLVLLVLLATAVRLVHLQAQSIWFDEGWSAYAADQPTLVGAAQSDSTNPPLYYVLINAAAHLWGSSEFGLRVFSLLVGLLTIPLVYRLASHVSGDRAGRYAALLASVSAPLWWASQEARMYTLLAALVLVAALAWHILLTQPQPRPRPQRAAWLALWLAELALLYAHNTGPVIALWLNAVTLLAWIGRRRFRLAGLDWRVWIGGQVAVGLLWLPYFVTRFVQVQAANSAITSAPAISFALLWNVWQGFWVAPWTLALRGLPELVLMAGIAGLVALLTIRRAALWLILHTLILTAGLIAGLIVLGNDLHGRYLVMIVPLLLAAVGVGIARLRDGRLRALVVTPFVVLLVFNTSAAASPSYQHDDVRTMVQFYADHLDADDTVIAWSYADRYDLAYYWDRLGVTAKRVTLPEGADLDAVLPLLPDSGSVALNVWYTQRADYRGMMGCILGSGMIEMPESFTTYGMTTLIYDHPALDLPALQPAEAVFTDTGGNPVAQVTAVGQVNAATPDRALCLPVQITLLRDVDVDLKAALIVQNDLGWEIARADAIFATANQRTSAALAPGGSLTAFPLLRLPYGAPAGSYRFLLRVYDEVAQPSGYIPSNGQVLSGRDLLLATWTALPGADWTRLESAGSVLYPRNDAVSPDLILFGAVFTPPVRAASISNGDSIRAALTWKGTGSLPDLELVSTDGSWRVTAPTRLTDHEAITLDWRLIRVPPDAPSGEAELRLSTGLELVHYFIKAQPMITEAPEYARAVGATFPDVGELIGYTLNDPPFSPAHPPQVTLIWRAGDSAPALDYTVFVQLIDEAGQVVAQSDAPPGNRATTGWRGGEYIVDAHTLTFNDAVARGTARLIVGLYDAETGNRVRLADGADAVELQSGMSVG